MSRIRSFVLVAVAWCTAFTGTAAARSDLQTSAELSRYRATTRYDDVVRFCRALATRSPLVRLDSLGRTVEGREIPLLVLSDPPIADAAAARASGKLILFAFGNIHAGEVCGKEALLMWARDLTDPDSAEGRALLRGSILLIAPIYNADGNERVAKDNRPGQNGPEDGMGQRPNAQGLDLNRDYMKLDSPEARAHVLLLNAWDPDLVIDTHTTNGSIHRFVLTYAAPQNPSGPLAPLEWTRDVLLPAVSARLRERTGDRTFFYGNFDRDKTKWMTYSSQPRFGAPYRGLRGHLSILSEAYAYASFEDRVRATLEFVRECAGYAVENAATIRSLRARARAEVIAAGERADGTERVGIRHEIAAFSGSVVIPSELTYRDGWNETSTGIAVDYAVTHFGRFRPTLTVSRPRAYLVPGELETIVEKLRQHGVRVEEEPVERPVACEVYRIDRVERADREFQGRHEVTIEATPRRERRVVGTGWYRVPMAQPLGTLALYLLEPESDDGLVTWGFFDPWVHEGHGFPVLREVE